MYETDPMQPCPECAGATGASDPECWRCGGDGFVDRHDPFEPSVRFRVYATTRLDPRSLATRITRTRASVVELEPEVELP